MALCNKNNTEPVTTPCEQVDPCNLVNPCKDAENSPVILKQYIDECCRKIYPITSMEAVISTDGTLVDSLNNLKTRIDALLTNIRNIEANNSYYSTAYNTLTTELSNLKAQVTILLGGGNTDIENRISNIENLIVNINSLLELLLGSIGGASCISDFSNPTILDNTVTYNLNQLTPSSVTNLQSNNDSYKTNVYKVTGGSIVSVKLQVINNTRNENEDGHFFLIICFYDKEPSLENMASDTPQQYKINRLSLVNDYTTGEIYTISDILIPLSANRLTVSYPNVDKTRKFITEPIVELVECPEEDDDESGSGGSGGGDENILKKVKYPTGTQLTIDETDKSVTLPDVVDVENQTTFDTNENKFIIPTVLPVHGYYRYKDEGVAQYPITDYFLSLDGNTFTPLTKLSLYKQRGIISDPGHESDKMINSGFLYPEKQYLHYCLMLSDSGDNKTGELFSSSGTTNKVVKVYKITKGESYRVKITNNEGDSAVYSIFGNTNEMSDFYDNTNPIQPLIAESFNSHHPNYTVSEFVVTAPSNFTGTLTPELTSYNNANHIYLAISHHMRGSLVVYKTLSSNSSFAEPIYIEDPSTLEEIDSIEPGTLWAIKLNNNDTIAHKIEIKPYTMFYEIDTDRFMWRTSNWLMTR